MPKKFLEDIKPLTSHDSPNVSVRRTAVAKTPVDIPLPQNIESREEEVSYDSVINPPRKNNRKTFVIGAAFLLTLGIVYAVLVTFSVSKVVLTKRIESGTIDVVATATKSDETSGIRFEIMSIEGEASKTIDSETKKNVSIKATGSVIIYNNFSTSSQKLVANTRLEAPDGKIYRLQKAVTVPGKTGSGDSAKPGSVEVSIVAEEGGESYNKELSDFKIPGFKGSPRYDGFFAKTKPGAGISGGKEGSLYVATISDPSVLQAELEVILREKLVEDAEAQIPEGYFLFTDAIILSQNENPIPKEVSGEEVKIAVSTSGKLDAVLFPIEDLEKFVASKTLSQYDDAGVSIENIKTLKFAFEKKYSDLKEEKEISFKLTGSPRIVWDIDTEEIKKNLLGKSKKEFNETMNTFKGVLSAELHLRPFFFTKIQTNEKRVELVVVEPGV
jgi:hypothetical protein